MPIEGKFSDVDRLAIRLRQAAQVFTPARARAARRIQADARRDYASGRNPDGRVWRRRKKDNALAMQRPGGTIRYFVSANNLIGIAEDVFKWHMLTRPPFPENGIPSKWATILDEEHIVALNDWLGDIV